MDKSFEDLLQSMMADFIPEHKKAADQYVQLGGTTQHLLDFIRNELSPNENLVSVMFYIAGKESNAASRNAWEYLRSRFNKNPELFRVASYSAHDLEPTSRYLMFAARKYLIKDDRLGVFIEQLRNVCPYQEQTSTSKGDAACLYHFWLIRFFLIYAYDCAEKNHATHIFDSDESICGIIRDLKNRKQACLSSDTDVKRKIENISEQFDYVEGLIQNNQYDDARKLLSDISLPTICYLHDLVDYIFLVPQDDKETQLERLQWYKRALLGIIRHDKLAIDNFADDVIDIYLDKIKPVKYTIEFVNLLCVDLHTKKSKIRKKLGKYLSIDYFKNIDSDEENAAYLALDAHIQTGCFEGYQILKELYLHHSSEIVPPTNNYFHFLLETFYSTSHAAYSVDINTPLGVGHLWEKLCQDICCRRYSNVLTNSMPNCILTNSALPDIAYGDIQRDKSGAITHASVIVECKKTMYFSYITHYRYFSPVNNPTTQKYYEYCDMLEYWILEKPKDFKAPKTDKIAFVFGVDLLAAEWVSDNEKQQIKDLLQDSDGNFKSKTAFHPSIANEGELIAMIDSYIEHCSIILGKYKKAQEVIRQYSKDGRFIAEYKNIAEAQAAVHVSKDSIQRCIRNERPTAGGYQWIRAQLGTESKMIPPLNLDSFSAAGKKIIQVDPSSGEVVNTFDTVRCASKGTGINEKSIRETLKQRQRTAGGYIWIFGEPTM